MMQRKRYKNPSMKINLRVNEISANKNLWKRFRYSYVVVVELLNKNITHIFDSKP